MRPGQCVWWGVWGVPQAVQQPNLAEEGNGSLPHGLCITNIGTDDFSKGLLHTLGKESRQ